MLRTQKKSHLFTNVKKNVSLYKKNVLKIKNYIANTKLKVVNIT